MIAAKDLKRKRQKMTEEELLEYVENSIKAANNLERTECTLFVKNFYNSVYDMLLSNGYSVCTPRYGEYIIYW